MIAGIFLSYSRKESQMKDRLANDLRRAGLSDWTDDGLAPSTRSWRKANENQIESAGFMGVILSPDAKKSELVEGELSYADLHKKRIFPAMARGDATSSVPISLINAQHADLRGEYDGPFAKLRDALKQHLRFLAPLRQVEDSPSRYRKAASTTSPSASPPSKPVSKTPSKSGSKAAEAITPPEKEEKLSPKVALALESAASAPRTLREKIARTLEKITHQAWPETILILGVAKKSISARRGLYWDDRR